MILRQGANIFVGFFIARYLLPHGLGIITLASTYLQLLMPLAQLGLNSIVIRDLIKSRENTSAILGTAFVLKLLASFFTFIAILIISFYATTDVTIRYYIIIYSLTVFFTPFQVIDFYFQSEVKAKFIAYAQQAASIISSILRLIGIWYRLDISWFIYCFVIELFITTSFLLILYTIKGQSVLNWRYDKGIALKLLKALLPVILSGFFIALYMRIDQLMIYEKLGSDSLGIYSAAVKLCEPFYIVSSIVVSSLFPAIINGLNIGRAEYEVRTQKLFNLLTALPIIVSIVIGFFANPIVHIVYGPGFEGAGKVVQIYFWASLFVFQGVVANQCFIAENIQKYSTIYTLIGALVNIVLNAIFLPYYGVIGAAYATLISYMLSATILNGLFKPTRPIFKQQLKAVLAIFSPKKLLQLK